jgi:hypothetical protein
MLLSEWPIPVRWVRRDWTDRAFELMMVLLIPHVRWQLLWRIWGWLTIQAALSLRL